MYFMNTQYRLQKILWVEEQIELILLKALSLFSVFQFQNSQWCLSIEGET